MKLDTSHFATRPKFVSWRVNGYGWLAKTTRQPDLWCVKRPEKKKESHDEADLLYWSQCEWLLSSGQKHVRFISGAFPRASTELHLVPRLFHEVLGRSSKPSPAQIVRADVQVTDRTGSDNTLWFTRATPSHKSNWPFFKNLPTAAVCFCLWWREMASYTVPCSKHLWKLNQKTVSSPKSALGKKRRKCDETQVATERDFNWSICPKWHRPLCKHALLEAAPSPQRLCSNFRTCACT